jgi:hypothetical protein
MTQKIVIAKPGFNAKTETLPYNLIFSSDYNTLKYDITGSISLQIDGGGGDIADGDSITHNLGYYPYVEAYVDVWILEVEKGNYEYCPFSGAGAAIFYTATFTVTKTKINFYAELDGVPASTWNFDFKYFIFKNDVNL